MNLLPHLFAALLVGSAVLQGTHPEPTPSEAATSVGAGRVVLITGASTGIGRVTAERLAAEGFFVYAGARKAADLAELSAIENVVGIRLDVTQPDEIAAAVRTITEAGRGLFGLINNAGIGVMGPLTELNDAQLDFQMDVNVMGPFRVTRAFAPLLFESQGRVCTTGSIAGTVTWGLGGPYTMSKHAIEAYTECLAQELEPFGVHVAVVEPGNYASHISASMRQRLLDQGYTTEGSRYKEQMEAFLAKENDRSHYKESTEVADAFLHALTAEKPKLRYMVVPNQREADMTIRASMRRIVQQNADQPYTLDRDALIQLLDEALAKSDE